MNNEFSGRVAVVTGASSGIGSSVAKLLAERGARVVLFARTPSPANGENMIAVTGDAAEEGDVARLFERCEEAFGACDLLIPCAGMIDPGPLAGTTPSRWDRMYAVNVRSVFLACRRALPGMIARSAGDIVVVSSISGVTGPEKFPGFVSYNSSKAALIAFAEALAVEVKGNGIRVNCVSPGSVDTKMWAAASGGAPADMTPVEVAETILFLASPRSKPMNGQNLHVYSA